MFNCKSNCVLVLGGSHQLLSWVSNTLCFYLFIFYCILIWVMWCVAETQTCFSKWIPSRYVVFGNAILILNQVWVIYRSWNMAIKELQLPVIFVLTDDPGTAHTRTCKQPDKQINTLTHTKSAWFVGDFLTNRPPKGKEAGINQLVSGLQTPTAPYHHTQADTLTDW